MSTKGSLKAGGFGKALQIVADEERSCVIHVRGPSERYAIHCLDERVVRALRGDAKPDEGLAQALLGGGVADPDQVEAALREVRRTDCDLPTAMATKMDRLELRRHLHIQLADVVHAVFALPRGGWEIADGEEPDKPWGFESLPAADLVSDGARVVEEWPKIRTIVDSPRLRFTKVGDLVVSPTQAELGPNEGLIFTLVRDDRDVADIESLARLGAFETQRALFQLTVAGHILPKDLSPERGAASPAALRAARRRRTVHAMGHLLVAVLVAMASLGAIRRALRPPPTAVAGAITDRATDLQTVMGDHQSARIATALEVFLLHTGSYPETLEEVVQAGLLRSDDLTYPLFDEPFVLRRSGERSYWLTPPLR